MIINNYYISKNSENQRS